MTRRFAAVFLGVGAILLTSIPAHAAPVEVTAVPHLGQDAPASPGWFSYLVRLRGTAGQTMAGTVEVTDGDGSVSRAPFATSGTERVAIEIPFPDAFGSGLEVIVRDPSGRVLTREPAASPRSFSPFLFDATPGSRLPIALRDERITPATLRMYSEPTEGLTLAVTQVVVDERTGEPLLPARAVSYASATVVSIRSELLVSLPENRWLALSDWVRTGGELAVTVGRAEDLRHGRLTALVGSGVTGGLSTDTARFVDFEVVPRTHAAGAAAAPVDGGGSPVLPVTGPSVAMASPTLAVTVDKVSPGAGVVAALQGFSGGQVRPTRWGAAADHGLGEVHLLAFDPNAKLFVDDPWVRRSMVDLVRYAWDRGTRVAITGGGAAFEEGRLHSLRRLLDPNEAGSWAVGVAAALLVLYSLVAIPITFRRAARRDRPLAVLYELPLWSLVTLVLIVGIGAVAKGGRARARRVVVVECASGETRCGIVRFRGLFASSADSMTVASTSPSTLVDVAGGTSDQSRTLVLERDATRLEDLQGRPWETLVFREDGTADLSGAVSLVMDGGDLTVVNGLGHALVGVVARAPGGDFRFLSRVESGQRAKLSSGTSLGSLGPTPALPPGPPVRPRPARSLEGYRFMSELDGVMPELGEAWSGVEPLARDAADFWPGDSAALIAGIEGWDDARTDSGLAVEKTWTLLRVVGKEQRANP